MRTSIEPYSNHAPKIRAVQAHAAVMVPETEAYKQTTAQMAVLPGSEAYRRWLELLLRGEITYGEFIDWTTPGYYPTRRERLSDLFETVFAGFRGMTLRKGCR